MDVPSFAFLAFAAAVASVLAFSTRPAWRRAVFLAANVAFLLAISHDPKSLAPLAGFVALGYGCIKWLERSKARLPFAVIVAGFVFAFAVLKHYTFLPGALALPFAYVTVGMSYIFFRILHVMIDTYQGAIETPVPPVSYVAFTLNFTSMIAGPIQLYPDYVRTEATPAPLDLALAARAVERIVLGFAKVVVFAPIFAAVQERALGLVGTSPSPERAPLAAAALVAYPVFLYLNFSGYMDVVIGAARFLRLELPENFNAPFVATGFMDFWGRWHITLSAWLKIYVYAPLFSSLIRRFPSKRAEPSLGILTFFVTFFLVGLWHGSTNMFVLYGLFLGLGVSGNKAYQLFMQARLGRKPYRALTERPLYRACSRGLTYTYFAVALLWFALSPAALGAFAAALGPAGVAGGIAIAFVAATAGIALCVAIGRFAAAHSGAVQVAFASRYARIGWSTALLFAVVSTMIVLNDPTPRIVYKAF